MLFTIYVVPKKDDVMEALSSTVTTKILKSIYFIGL